MKITVVLLNYKSWNETKDCLASLSKLHSRHKIEVVVVDVASTESGKTRICEDSAVYNSLDATFIYTKDNVGFSGGNNIGIKTALKHGAEYVVLLNNDTITSPDFLEPLIRTSRRYNDMSIICPKIYFAPGYEYHKSRYKQQDRGKVIWYAGGHLDWSNVYASHRGVDSVDEGQFDTRVETDFVSGCCMCISRVAIEDIGLLDEQYFLYYEDVDYCMRAVRKGYKLIYEPSSVIWHKNAQSSGKSGSHTQLYYQTRNRLRFGMKYAPVRSRIALVRESIKFLSTQGIKRRAVVDYYTGKVGFFNDR